MCRKIECLWFLSVQLDTYKEDGALEERKLKLCKTLDQVSLTVYMSICLVRNILHIKVIY